MVFSYLETRNNSLNYIYSNKKKNKISIYTKTKKANISARFLLVVMDGIEPPTQGFSVLCSTD